MFATAIFSMSLALADAAPTKKTFNIDAQPANTSLTLYARQAKVQLGFVPDIVDDVLTNPVKGEYESAQALELLLQGTGLEAEHGESGIVIRRVSPHELKSGFEAPEPAIASANSLRLVQAARQMPSRIPTTSKAKFNDDEYEEAVRKREEIVVTGSRIRGAQNASPVVTITREEIDQAGFATVEELVDKLPQNFGAGASLDTNGDALNNSRAVGGNVDIISGGASVNLRGLGASSTLILLNGRRMNPSGRSARFTDISAIPVSAIERVEVLTDGASAIYGSDAIGGVVNFILRDDYEGAETRLRYGSDSGGDTSEILLGHSYGKSWDSGHLLVSYEYYKHDNLANIDRDFTSTNDLSRFGGTDFRTPGGNPANIVAGGQTFAIPAEQDGTALTVTDFDPNAPRNLFNARADTQLLPQQERHSGLLYLSQNVGFAELFAEMRFATRDSISLSSPGTLSIDVPDTNPFFVDPTGTGLSSVTVDNYSLIDDLGPSFGSNQTDSYGSVFGVKFNISENWNSELAASWSREEAKARGNYLFESPTALAALADAVRQTDPDLAFNPFGDGSNTNPAVLETLRAFRTGKDRNVAENELRSVGFNVDGRAFEMPGGAVQLATGIGFREESLLALNSQNATSLQLETDRARDVLAIYAELFFPLIGADNNRPGLRQLEFSLAGRYEDYSDFGSSINPKVGLVWSPTQALTLKGTYGTSFRAPALVDLDLTNSANTFVYLPQFFVDIGAVPFTALVLQGASEDLQAEGATTWTAGFQWRPERVKGLSINATYFAVDFEDRIDSPFSNIILGLTDPRFASLLNTSPTSEQIGAVVNDARYLETVFGFTTLAEDILSGAAAVSGILDRRKNNLSQSIVTGAEFLLSYQIETAFGSFDIGLNGNYLFDFERQFIAADPLVDEVDTLGRPVDFRARGNMTWRRQGWTVSGFVNYIDGYTDNVSNPARPVDSWTTLDLTVTYNTGVDNGLFSDTRLSWTAQNVFDEDPPFVNTLGGLAYDTANADGLGRFLAIQIIKSW